MDLVRPLIAAEMTQLTHHDFAPWACHVTRKQCIGLLECHGESLCHLEQFCSRYVERPISRSYTALHGLSGNKQLALKETMSWLT